MISLDAVATFCCDACEAAVIVQGRGRHWNPAEPELREIRFGLPLPDLWQVEDGLVRCPTCVVFAEIVAGVEAA